MVKFRLVATRTESGLKAGAPRQPPGFRKIEGDYKKVSSVAVRMNDAQKRRTRQDYTFSPEPIREEARHEH